MFICFQPQKYAPRSMSAQVPSTKGPRRSSQNEAQAQATGIIPPPPPASLGVTDVHVTPPGPPRPVPALAQVALRQGAVPPSGRQALSMQPGHICKSMFSFLQSVVAPISLGC